MPTPTLTPDQLNQYVAATTTKILIDLVEAGMDAARLQAASITIKHHLTGLAMDLVLEITVFDEDEEE